LRKRSGLEDRASPNGRSSVSEPFDDFAGMNEWSDWSVLAPQRGTVVPSTALRVSDRSEAHLAPGAGWSAEGPAPPDRSTPP
jgi:hypothetical protein